MTEAPRRSETMRRSIGLALAPAVFVVLWLAPLPLSTEAHRLAAVFAAVVVLWVSEAIPIAATALLIAPLLVLTSVTDAKTAFAPYADPLLFLFVGGFFIARSMMRHGLDRRFAGSLIALPLFRGAPLRVRAALMITAVLLSSWISNTASAAILVPIMMGLLRDDGRDPRAIPGSLLALGYACSIGGLGTLVGSPPNLIAIRFLREQGTDFGFVDWMLVGTPAALLLTALTFVLFAKTAPPPPVPDDRESAQLAKRPWSRGEQVTALAFGLAVTGWVVPGVMKAAGLPYADELSRALPAGSVALLAASTLFVFRDEKAKMVLPWSDAAKIDWGIIMLFGGGISLGTQMFDSGLAAALSRGFVALSGVTDLWTLTAVVIVFTIFFTEVCSNTASANMLTPLVLAVAMDLEVPSIPPVLGVALAASCAFMLPIATGPNAVIYGTGKIPLPHMMRSGLILNIACAVAIFGILRVLCPLYGWT